MKFQILIKMLMFLLAKKQISASEIANRYNISVRTVYRYVEELVLAGIPLDIIRGRYGGICLPDTYKLPENFLTENEYKSAIGAMTALYNQLPEENLKTAIEKLASRQKIDAKNLSVSGNILIDSGTWGDTYHFSDKLTVVEQAIDDCLTLEIDYFNRNGENSKRKIEPHLLVLKQNIWYVYAYCHVRQEFRLFKIARIKSAKFCEKFTKRPFEKKNIPLNFWHDVNNLITINFDIEKKALPDVEEWLGVENIVKCEDKFCAEVNLAFDQSLIGKILSFGDGLKVVSPTKLNEDIKNIIDKLNKNYNN